MSETFHCDDKEQLVAYLYDDLPVPARRRVDEHLRVCAACAAEVAGLAGVRRELAAWAPPDADLGFTIVPTSARAASAEVVRPARWWRPTPMPAWARAAAAVLIGAVGLSIANLQVRYGADGLVVTTGWMRTDRAATPATPSASAAASTTPTDVAAAQADWRPALVALESSLRKEIATSRSTPATAGRTVGADEVSLRRIAELIEQSERRQQQELALRLTQFSRDLEVQRRSDLVRINQGFGQFEGRTGAEFARQRQLLENIIRVSAPPQ